MENKQKFAVFFSHASKGRRWGAVLSWLAALALVIAMVVPGFSMKSQLSDMLEVLIGESAYEQVISGVSDSLPEGTEAMAPVLSGESTSVLSYLIKYDGPIHTYEALYNGETESHAWNYVQLDGKWYAIDVTWDDPIIIGNGYVSESTKYKHFLKGSNTFFASHKEEGNITDNSIEFNFPELSREDY